MTDLELEALQMALAEWKGDKRALIIRRLVVDCIGITCLACVQCSIAYPFFGAVTMIAILIAIGMLGVRDFLFKRIRACEQQMGKIEARLSQL